MNKTIKLTLTFILFTINFAQAQDTKSFYDALITLHDAAQEDCVDINLKGLYEDAKAYAVEFHGTEFDEDLISTTDLTVEEAVEIIKEELGFTT